jgi:PilZ domain
LKREQRRTPRYTFIASAELIEQKTDVRIATRVSELSLHGCYLDMMNPFPEETLVLVKIFAGEDFFQAKAKIIYVQPNLGCGVSFLEVEPQPLVVLRHWLDTAQKDGQQRSG